MNEAVTTKQQSSMISPEDVQTLVSSGVIPAGTPEGNIKLFVKYCTESGLSPFKRQVHLVRRGQKYTIQTGIDGYRAIADGTRRYAGNDDYKFDEGLSEYEHIKSSRGRPTTATATVYKMVEGIAVAFSATARWDEYFPGKEQGFMWEKMPYLMLGKCAEALALRKAFPEELGGLYTDDEMQQAGVVSDVQHVPVVGAATEVLSDVSTDKTKLKNEDFEIPLGYLKGKRLGDVSKTELQKTVDWCEKNGRFPDVINKIKDYLADDGLTFNNKSGPANEPTTPPAETGEEMLTGGERGKYAKDPFDAVLGRPKGEQDMNFMLGSIRTAKTKKTLQTVAAMMQGKHSKKEITDEQRDRIQKALDERQTELSSK